MSANTKLIAALTTGAVLGAAAGLLLAPNPGKETRKVVAAQSGQLRHKAGHYIGNLRGSLRRRENGGKVDDKVQVPTE
ncbi:MAG: YtxH domain-containing protein [Chloroflexi bacterium]|nr:YtxH domain-containing protein [Chloroflexota bacterium]MCH8351716.1 YtxH domain-containing protein [Chloroflexota bacterium]MCI0792180.1 YtxH domain-containing protein [Chloroflexota bacterium]MCI0798076.1 YtxH domain-containing protein [Chloroflexota bacterium]MCI0860269.1 YtxH domain-containing protein [Chloroflexota bacterium]